MNILPATTIIIIIIILKTVAYHLHGKPGNSSWKIKWYDNNNNNNNNRIFIQDNPSVQSTVINGVLFHKDKDQTITPGTPRPTLCDKCVGSLTSHRVMNIEVFVRRDLRFIVLIRED